MPTVIDSLIVTLGLDPKQFKKGEQEYIASLRNMEKQSGKTNKALSQDTQKSIDVFKTMRNEVLGLAAAFLSVGAVKSFVGDITKSDAALGRMAGNINSSTEELSLWQGVVKRINGGDGAAVIKTFEGITRSMQQFQMWGTYNDSMKLFGFYDIPLIDKATGKARAFTDVMLDTSRVMEKMDKAKAHEVGYGMGLDNDLINVLQQGPQMTLKYLAEQKNVVSPEDAKKAQERQEVEAQLTASLHELGRSIVSDLTPSILEATKWLKNLVEWFNTKTEGHPVDNLGKTLDEKLQGQQKAIDLRKKFSDSDLGGMVRKLESGDKYGAINTDKSNVSGMALTEMKAAYAYGYNSRTINEVIAEERAGKYQAFGAYQMRANTLADAVRTMNLTGNEKLDRAMQDRISNEFLFARRTGGSKDDQVSGLIKEWDALKGHESDIIRLLPESSGSVSNVNTKSSTVSINNVHVTTDARNTGELIGDLKNQINKNYGLVSQGNSAF